MQNGSFRRITICAYLVRPPADSKWNRGDEQMAHTSYGRCLACVVVHEFIFRCWLETDILDGDESFQDESFQ